MRADRLLSIIEILRAARGVVTAEQLAEATEVHVRTIYRDIATLIARGTPIVGERGHGYILGPGLDVPPMMFDRAELEALMLGAHMVAAFSDATTAAAAERVVAKVGAVLPRHRAHEFAEAPLFAISFKSRRQDLEPLHQALRDQRIVELDYVDRDGAPTVRRVWPLALGFVDGRWALVAWCTLRQGFRHFRADRIGSFSVSAETYPGLRAAYLSDWRREVVAEVGQRAVSGLGHPSEPSQS